MAPDTFYRLFLVLVFLHQVFCLTHEEDVNKCEISIYLNSDAIWQQLTKTTNISADTKTSHVSVCCEGYVDSKPPFCNRKCPTESCISGFCPPGDENTNCKCYSSRHIFINNFKCIPLCQPNSNCTLKESCKQDCTCQSGYTKDTRTNLCVPTECFHRCTQGKCDQRGACTFSGSNQAYTNGSLTLKTCLENCLNGSCDPDGNCICDEGFKSVNNSSCRKILCPSTNKNDNLYCRKQCGALCVNGSCSQAGKCVCPAGQYVDDTNKCVALCVSGCVDGNCTECLCLEGFLRVNGSCVVGESVLRWSWIGGGAVAGAGAFLVIVVVILYYKKTERLSRVGARQV